MTERNFPDCKPGFHDNLAGGVPSISSPLLLDEARHLVYVFCDKDNSSKNHRHRYKRSYCSLCRHFHKETYYKEGFEKYFARETIKDHRLERNGREKEDLTSEQNEDGRQGDSSVVSQEKGWNTLTVEGLKIYKVGGKTSQRSNKKTEGLEGEGKLPKKEEQSKCVSARNGCATCEKRRENLQQSQGTNKSNKRIIKIVLPPTESKSRLSDH